MAEWLRRGLQILARRFDSGSGLQPYSGTIAERGELDRFRGGVAVAISVASNPLKVAAATC
jgi:hypothetical protein